MTTVNNRRKYLIVMIVMTNDLEEVKIISTKRLQIRTEKEGDVVTLRHLSLFWATLMNMVLLHEPNIVAVNNSFDLSTGSWAAGESNRVLLFRK